MLDPKAIDLLNEARVSITQAQVILSVAAGDRDFHGLEQEIWGLSQEAWWCLWNLSKKVEELQERESE